MDRCIKKLKKLSLLTGSVIFIFLYNACANEPVVSPSQLADLIHGKETYFSPLGEPLHVTGTVGEFRYSHYHFGLDISTYDALGRPVYAVRKGFIIRLMYQRYGIGYAIWIQHADGLVSMYGHLREFAPHIQKHPALAAFANDMRERREFVASLHPEVMHVSRGQYIAHSGESGLGPHHLHFELQDGRTRLNPLLHGIPFIDEQVPILHYAVLHPASTTARINGRYVSVKIPLKLSKKDGMRHIYTASTMPRISGSVRLQLATHDPSGRSRLGVAAGELRLANKERFTFAFERLPRLPPNHQFVLYDRKHTRLRGGAHYLYNFSEVYTGFMPMARSVYKGYIRSTEIHPDEPLELSVMDAAGHQAVAFLQLQADTNHYPALKISKSNLNHRGQIIERGQSAVLYSKDRKFQVVLHADSLFEDSAFRVQTKIRRVHLPAGLRQLTRVYSLQPGGLPLAGHMSASLQGPPGERMAVYRINGRNIYSLGRRVLYTQGRWRFQDSYTGSYVLLEDRASPRWLKPKIKIMPQLTKLQRDAIAKNKSILNSDVVWPHQPSFRLFLYAKDIGSGLDYDTIKIQIDGQVALAEHDGDHKRLEIFAPATIYRKGIHKVEARINDHAGNSAEVLKFRYLGGMRPRVLP